MLNFVKFSVSALLFTLFLLPTQIPANERKFSYIYESAVLGKGSKEIELWSTPRIGKNEGFYARLDHRIEFEVGISNKLQAAFYLNFRNVTRDNNTGTNTTEFRFQGFSTEFKYQVSSPSRDALGFALYGEAGFNTDELELETKLIFDKRIKKTTLALNLVFEPEWHLTPGKSELEMKLEGVFGLSYAFSPIFSAGFETRQVNVMNDEGEIEHSAFFAGPVISVSQPSWWMALTVLPQVAGLKGQPEGKTLNVAEFEKFETRLLVAFHL